MKFLKNETLSKVFFSGGRGDIGAINVRTLRGRQK